MAAAIGAVWFGLLAGCRHEPERQLVFLIGIDTLRADFLEAGSPAQTPNLDALRAESRVYSAAYATAPWTQPSLASVMTGRWPWQHGVTRLLDPLPTKEFTLAEALRANGWRTSGVMSNFVATGAMSYGQGFERWDETLATGHEAITSDAVVERTLLNLDANASAQFHFLYLFDPHWLYQPSDAHRELAITRYHELGVLREELNTLTATERAELERVYSDDVERVDRAIGHLCAELKRRGLWDSSSIVLFADHGEYLGETTWDGAAWVGHTVDLSDTLMRVPLWVHGPHVTPGVVTEPVSLIDLGATVLDVAGLPAELGEGRSLLTAPRRDTLYMHVDFQPALLRADSQRKRSLMWGVVDRPSRKKWAVNHLGLAGPEGLLFDLSNGLEKPMDASLVPSSLKSLTGLVPEPLGDRSGAEGVRPK